MLTALGHHRPGRGPRVGASALFRRALYPTPEGISEWGGEGIMQFIIAIVVIIVLVVIILQFI